MYMEYLTVWNLVIELNEKVSPRQVLHIHTQTNGNDIGPRTAQICNERTSTNLNLVTAQSTVHEPPEDGF